MLTWISPRHSPVLIIHTFEVEGDPDPEGAGADPRAVQDGLRRRHGRQPPLGSCSDTTVAPGCGVRPVMDEDELTKNACLGFSCCVKSTRVGKPEKDN